MKTKNYHYSLSFTEIEVQVTWAGRDCSIVIAGGDKPHVGCTVLAVPRPALTGDGSISVTSSVMNAVGHKDEEICRYLAEQMAKKHEAVVVCSGGIHMEHADRAMIQEILGAMKGIAEEIVL